LADVQRLMIERMLLPFAFFAKHTEDRRQVYDHCFKEGGRGKSLDARTSDMDSALRGVSRL
jgi:hypothetical protein